MVFDSVNGLPLHPLVVHAVVVLLPLAAVGVVAIAVSPALRARFGWLVVAVAAAATAAVPVATRSGESLAERVGVPGGHADLGETLIWFALPLLAVAVAVAVMAVRRRAAGASGRSPLMVALAVVGVLAAGAAVFQVYRVGDSGARVVWGHTPPARDR